MIRAVVRDGAIQPLDPLPAEWEDGKELIIEEDTEIPDAQSLAEWKREMDEAAAAIPIDQHHQLLKILAEAEEESKAAVRREWGLE
jgi:hypothetical protein